MSQIDFFNSVAKNWDNMIEVNYSKINYLLSKLEIKEDDSILDVGTGTGILIPFLDNLVPSGFIKGIDISKGMLEVALEKYGNKSNITFDLVDVENDKIDNEYDKIILYSMYPHLKNKTETIKKLVSNNLKHNGILMIAHSNSRFFLNNLHSNVDKRLKDSLLLEVNEQKKIFQNVGLNVVEAFENNEMYYLVVHKK